ncbi:hypothetical protein AMECASPLE_036420 [Ameca splendens]|uniref:Uncharacterized protein n=1 Tax=Ameca splendens TaxID=208324 RepID=A0ABV0XKP3_9TELE
MCMVGIMLVSTQERVKVSAQSETIITVVQHDPQALTFAYEWKVQKSLLSHQLLVEVQGVVTPCSDFMQSAYLLYTSLVSLGPDKEYEKVWFCMSCEKLTTSMLYWNADTAGLAVCLKP